MKKIILLSLLVLFTTNALGQYKKQDSIDAVTDFTKLKTDFGTKKEMHEIEDKKFEKLKGRLFINSNPKIVDSIKVQLDISQKRLAELDEQYVLFESYKKVYLNKGISEKMIDSLFTHKHIVSGQTADNIAETKTYLYFGKDEVIEEWKPTGNKKYDDIIKSVLSKESETHLGDITIPKEMQPFDFYKLDTTGKKIEGGNRIYKFKSISFEILDGFFTNIKVFVLDENGTEHLFENEAPVSILNYSIVAPKNYLFYRHPFQQNGIVNFDVYKDLRIRLSDVLMYTSKPGSNYIPNNVTFDLPTKDSEGEILNKNSYIKYKIKENTSLQNAVELRAYTDFLGLFGGTPNGIVQLEGRGDFYLFPFRTSYNLDMRFFDKVSPYVNFSKIDDDVRAVKTITLENTNVGPANNLELVQKSYLEMGAKLNLFNIRFRKETPFRLIVYTPFRYQIADVLIKDQFKNIQGFAFGAGLTAEVKRFNNFGFNYSFEISQYNFKDHNVVETFEAPDSFGVIRNEAEIFYYPGKEKNQSIFLKLKTFNNISSHEAFYQLQFGYRFSIGLSNVKTKTN